MSNINNIPVLDGIRALAALLVCAYHFIFTTEGYFQSKMIRSVFEAGQYGVEMFFVVSGLVIPWAMYHAGFEIRNLFRFLLKRLVRLEPPYIFSIALTLFMLYVRQHIFGKTNDHIEVSATQIALHFGYLIPFFDKYDWLNPVYWTLAIEFQYYILIALLFIPLMRANLVVRGIIFLALLSMSFISSMMFITYWFPFFLLGILLFMYLSERISVIEFYIWQLITLVLCFINFPVMAVVCALVPVILVVWNKDLKIPVLNGIGKFSYSIYLIHPVIGSTVVNYFSHSMTGPFQKFLLITSGFIVTLTGSWITYVLVEKPSKKFSSLLKYKPIIQKL